MKACLVKRLHRCVVLKVKVTAKVQNFIDRTLGCGDCDNLHRLGCQRSHERRRFKFYVSLWGVVSSCQFAPHHSESVFVCLCRSARWLAQSASTVCPMLCIDRSPGDHHGMPVLCAVLRRVQTIIKPVSS